MSARPRPRAGPRQAALLQPQAVPRDRRFVGALVVALGKLLGVGDLPGPAETAWLA